MKNIAAIASDLMTEVSSLRAELALARRCVEAARAVVALGEGTMMGMMVVNYSNVKERDLIYAIAAYDAATKVTK